ncbi:hypothetical protein GOODEAATRI_007101 [Goodea atripinnis]|uniref:FCS-type domain-containing protein n=1 Tax=Goodea atripinnis TaxID=208336 RepID=A0ABV0MPZ8_9TELE
MPSSQRYASPYYPEQSLKSMKNILDQSLLLHYLHRFCFSSSDLLHSDPGPVCVPGGLRAGGAGVAAPSFLKCEYCKNFAPASQFRGTKRFCSMSCAKRYFTRMKHVKQCCEDLASQFLSQEIDGQALLLLKEEHLMSTMNIKLGPALKICAHINNLRD